MDIPTLWPSLTAETRAWLIEHNGEGLSPAVVDEIAAANGGSIDSNWWSEDAEEPRTLRDDAVDWIEAVANEEEPANSE